MARSNAGLQKNQSFATQMVPSEEMYKHIDTPLYFGGLLYKSHASVQPKKLYHGLLELSLAAGGGFW
tara:strand:+ start:48 stop:248 length:201 start_codon:yes stop_codon:yes gene_type:complete